MRSYRADCIIREGKRGIEKKIARIKGLFPVEGRPVHSRQYIDNTDI
jgi:hypothetical protein